MIADLNPSDFPKTSKPRAQPKQSQSHTQKSKNQHNPKQPQKPDSQQSNRNKKPLHSPGATSTASPADNNKQHVQQAIVVADSFDDRFEPITQDIPRVKITDKQFFDIFGSFVFVFV